MKVVRKYSSAARLAGGRPILQITGPGGGRMFVVFDSKRSLDALAQTEVALLRSGNYCGNVSLKDLNRLGNANHAIGREPSMYNAFTPEKEPVDG